MPKSYRYATLALVGFLVAASPPRARARHETAQAEQSATDSLSKIAAALQKANEVKAPDRGCPKGKPDRQSDLCAQWKAADAAAESVVWAERTYRLGVGGLLVGLLTLGAAGAAAYFARDAVLETRAGNRIANNSDKLQNEPKLVIEHVRFSLTRNDGVSSINWGLSGQNNGNSRAYDLTAAGSGAVTDQDGNNIWSDAHFIKSANVSVVQPLHKFDCDEASLPDSATIGRIIDKVIESEKVSLDLLLHLAFKSEYGETIDVTFRYSGPGQLMKTEPGKGEWVLFYSKLDSTEIDRRASR